jgi:hypothetical protein
MLGAAAAAAPAALFLGAGTAQADNLQVSISPTVGGVGIQVRDQGGSGPLGVGASSLSGCVYSSTPNTTGIPYFGPPFELNASNPTFSWFAPGLETGTTWKIAVNCAQGGAQNVTPSTITF